MSTYILAHSWCNIESVHCTRTVQYTCALIWWLTWSCRVKYVNIIRHNIGAGGGSDNITYTVVLGAGYKIILPTMDAGDDKIIRYRYTGCN